jgi:hypothetical protein
MSETKFKIRMPDRSQIAQMLASYDENDREIDDHYGYGSDITDENDCEIDDHYGYGSDITDENDREIDDHYGYGSDITDENDCEIDEFEGNEIFDNFILPEEMKFIKNLENGLDLDYDEDD